MKRSPRSWNDLRLTRLFLVPEEDVREEPERLAMISGAASMLPNDHVEPARSK